MELARSKNVYLARIDSGLKYLHSYQGERSWDTRLQLADVLKMAGALGFGTVHKKLKFSVMGGHVRPDPP